MAPLSTVASVKATHAVMTSGSLRPQYVASWCQDTNAESRGPLMKKLVLQHQEVRAQHVLDGVEDGRMTHEVGQPGEQQVRLLSDLGGERSTVRGLDGLEPPAVFTRLAGRQDRDREVEAIAVVALDGGGCECLHAVLAHTA